MASSFSSQIPCILNLIEGLHPKSILDIGKGFGKYGFLIHEYIGLDNTSKIDPSQTLVQQSQLVINAVEADPDLMLPHLAHLYNMVFFKDIVVSYEELSNHDLVLMIDIIEHLEKTDGTKILKHFLAQGSKIIIATPTVFFEQYLYESEFERHKSVWSLKDFQGLGFVSYQYINGNGVYLLSAEKITIRGFGNSILSRLKRVYRAIRNEIG